MGHNGGLFLGIGRICLIFKSQISQQNAPFAGRLRMMSIKKMWLYVWRLSQFSCDLQKIARSGIFSPCCSRKTIRYFILLTFATILKCFCCRSENGRRQGYMGHLIEIATVINSTLKENPFLESLLNEIDPDLLIQWNHLVQDELNPTLELQKQCLVSEETLFTSFCLIIDCEWTF